MIAEAQRLLDTGYDGPRIRSLLDLRYVGQEFTLPVPVSADSRSSAADRAAIRAAFDALHEQRYAHHATDEPVEIINMRLVALGRRAKAGLAAAAQPGAALHKPSGSAGRISIEGEHRSSARFMSAMNLPRRREFEGPALVSEYGSTTVLFPATACAVARYRRTHHFRGAGA